GEGVMHRKTLGFATLYKSGTLGQVLLLLCLVLAPRASLGADVPTITYQNGDIYVGEIHNGQRHGQGTYTFHDGKKYVGAWQKDQRHGQGTLTFPNGDVYTGEFAQGMFRG